MKTLDSDLTVRMESNAARGQPPCICKSSNSKIRCESYTEENFRLIGQARSSFHLSVLKSVYIKTEKTEITAVLCRQK